MKKIILCLIAMGLSVGAFAQNNEFGVMVGGFNGLSYKRIVNEKFAIQTDLGVGLQATAFNIDGIAGSTHLFDFVINPNFLYNKELKSNIYAFLGMGINLGLAQELNIPEITYGKFGVNAMAGFGFKVQKLPLSISLDFRPGYAMLFNSNFDSLINIFDWHLALGARYCF